MKEKNEEHYICMGEMDGDHQFRNENIIVDWGDNTYSTIKND